MFKTTSTIAFLCAMTTASANSLHDDYSMNFFTPEVSLGANALLVCLNDNDIALLERNSDALRIAPRSTALENFAAKYDSGEFSDMKVIPPLLPTDILDCKSALEHLMDRFID